MVTIPNISLVVYRRLPFYQKYWKIKIVMKTDLNGQDAKQIYGSRKNDNRILIAVLSLKNQFKRRKVIMVTKDINLRIKGKAIGIPAEDYKTGKV